VSRGSSNQNRPISLVPCMRNVMLLWTWRCRMPIQTQHSLLFAVVIGIITILQAYVLAGMAAH
jgi:hypothetical protein